MPPVYRRFSCVVRRFMVFLRRLAFCATAGFARLYGVSSPPGLSALLPVSQRLYGVFRRLGFLRAAGFAAALWCFFAAWAFCSAAGFAAAL
jgi:hypothetical protein